MSRAPWPRSAPRRSRAPTTSHPVIATAPVCLGSKRGAGASPTATVRAAAARAHQAQRWTVPARNDGAPRMAGPEGGSPGQAMRSLVEGRHQEHRRGGGSFGIRCGAAQSGAAPAIAWKESRRGGAWPGPGRVASGLTALFFPFRPRKPSMLLLHRLLALAVVSASALLAGACASAQTAPAPSHAQPPFHVGVTSLRFRDEARQRPLATTLW